MLQVNFEIMKQLHITANISTNQVSIDLINRNSKDLIVSILSSKTGSSGARGRRGWGSLRLPVGAETDIEREINDVLPGIKQHPRRVSTRSQQHSYLSHNLFSRSDRTPPVLHAATRAEKEPSTGVNFWRSCGNRARPISILSSGIRRNVSHQTTLSRVRQK